MISKKYRLHKDFFRTIRVRPQTYRTKNLILSYFHSGVEVRQPPFCFACVVSKKVEKTSVGRNRTRRRVYVALRSLMDKTHPGIFVVHVRQNINNVPFFVLQKEIEELVGGVK